MKPRQLIFLWAITTIALWALGVAWMQFGPREDDLAMANSLGFQMVAVAGIISIPSLMVFYLIWATDAFMTSRRSNRAIDSDAGKRCALPRAHHRGR